MAIIVPEGHLTVIWAQDLPIFVFIPATIVRLKSYTLLFIKGTSDLPGTFGPCKP